MEAPHSEDMGPSCSGRGSVLTTRGTGGFSSPGRCLLGAPVSASPGAPDPSLQGPQHEVPEEPLPDSGRRPPCPPQS